MTAYTTAETISGTVRGSASDGIATYLAVPYAAPLRFAAPQNDTASFFGLDMVAVTGAEWR
jgi:carboxylesterase type B